MNGHKILVAGSLWSPTLLCVSRWTITLHG